MIYFLCPKPSAPSGGVQFIHNIVRLLNGVGLESKVLLTEPFDCWWMAHPIPDSMIGSVRDSIQDGSTLVVPECLWAGRFPPRLALGDYRRVVFVQNYIWLPDGFEYHQVETLVCSRYLANHMQRLHRANVIGLVRPYLDNDLWQPTPKKANRVLVVARRNPYHEQVRDMLQAAGFDVDYSTEPMTQAELSARFVDAEFYVHLVHPEGFPLIALEAMRSGAIVVGTTGGGGQEFMFHRETAMAVADPQHGHYLTEDFLNGIVDNLNALRADQNLRSRIWQQAHNWSLRYTAEATTQELISIFGRHA